MVKVFAGIYQAQTPVRALQPGPERSSMQEAILLDKQIHKNKETSFKKFGLKFFLSVLEIFQFGLQILHAPLQYYVFFI